MADFYTILLYCYYWYHSFPEYLLVEYLVVNLVVGLEEVDSVEVETEEGLEEVEDLVVDLVEEERVGDLAEDLEVEMEEVETVEVEKDQE